MATQQIIPLEDVFKTSGIPTYTFVKPQEYIRLLVALRTPGRGLIIEGPSGIGKTTCINKAIRELGYSNVCLLSARKKQDLELIYALPTFSKDLGIVIVDDFHVLDVETKQTLSNFLKTLADEDDQNTKLILIGINKAGDSLVQCAPDLNNRIDTIKFESNSDEKIEELIKLGEQALNVTINAKVDIIHESKGSFHIAQMLCKDACICSNIIANDNNHHIEITVSIDVIKENVMTELARNFHARARDFACGPRLRREGRAPYLHLLYWLAKSDQWSITIPEVLHLHPEMKLSIRQIIDKGFLERFLQENPSLNDVLHFDLQSSVLTIEDPKFLFYIRNILWNKFAEQIGYTEIEFTRPYDIALSFAGSDRDIAYQLYANLSEREIHVFYDENEQSRILAENVEDYLAPIYKTEAEFVVVIMGREYPQRIWTKFESTQFNDKFGENRVIPIWFADIDYSAFDQTRKVGGMTINRSGEISPQIEKIVQAISEKIEITRNKRKYKID